MAEALAIIPLILTGLKLAKKYGVKAVKIKSSYMETADESRLMFEMQVDAFLHECKTMLHAAADGKDDIDVGRLLDDAEEGEEWHSPGLENCLQSYLGTSQAKFKTLLNVICKKISKIDEELGRYDQVDENGKEGGSVLHRLGHRASVPSKEEAYDKEIETLQRLVADLKGLRKRTATDKPRLALQKPDKIPIEYQTRREDAAMWLMVISETWSCNSDGHCSHCAKLLVAHEPRRGRGCLHIVIHQATATVGVLTNQQICVQAGPASGCRTSAPAEKNPPVSCSLAARGNVCGALSASSSPFFFAGHEPASLGYVECRLRKFDIFPGHCPRGQPRPYLWGTPVPLCGIFARDLDASLGDAHRFWLAGLVVKSALIHHRTAWWPEDWTLDRLSFYERPADELASSLQTLHLTADLPHNTTTAAAAGKDPVDYKRAMRQCGIRNLTLWCVGVALLQIALWRPIRWDDHVDVRDCLESLEARPLGRHYTEMTDRLINCDFGRRADMQSSELQDEIYRTVVCELDAAMDEFRRAGIWAH